MTAQAAPVTADGLDVHDLSATALYLSVGLPGGYVVDMTTSNDEMRAGAVRCRGEVVFLDAVDYWVWTVGLNPMPMTTMNEIAAEQGMSRVDSALGLLRERGLVIALDSWEAASAALDSVRAIPLGYAMGNAYGDPTQFHLQDAKMSQPSPVRLNPVENLLWSEFDGSSSVRHAVSTVAARMPSLADGAVETIAIGLVLRLMRQRLVYLDVTVQSSPRE